MSGSFQDQIVVISGGVGDIGFAVAKEFAAQGASIALGDIREEGDVQALIKQLQPFDAV